ncbi:MAG: O-antigen ligase family protein [Myxococcota bacterium]
MSDAKSDANSDDGAPETSKEAGLGAATWIVMALLALLPPLFVTGFSSFETVKNVVFAAGASLALVIWAVQTVRAGRISMVAGRVGIIWILWGLFSLAGVGWAPNELLGLVDAVHLASIAAVGTIVLAPTGRPLRFRDFSNAVAVGAGVAGLFGLLDLVGVAVFTQVWDPPGATGSFDALEFAIGFYAVSLPVLMAAIWRYADKSRFVYATAFVLAAAHFGLAAGWTVFAFFGAAVLVAWLLVVVLQRGQAMGVLYPAVAMAVILAILVGAGQAFFPTKPGPTDATSLPYLKRPNVVSDKQRAERMIRNPVFSIGRTESMLDQKMHEYLLGQSREYISSKPFLGHGPGAWWATQTSNIDPDDPFVAGMFEVYPAFRSTHNAYTKLLVEWGVVGLALFLLWVLGALVVSIRALMKVAERPEWMLEHWALLTSFFAGLVFMGFTPMLEFSPGILVWAVAAGLMMRLSGVATSYSGSTSIWESDSRGQVLGVCVLAGVIGAGMLVPTFMNGMAERKRGAGDQYMLRTRHQEAINFYQEADDWYPAHGDVAYNVALAARRLGQLDQLHSYVDYAMELRPFDVRVLNLKGHALLQDREQYEALKVGRRALESFPNSERAQTLVISALDLTEQFKAAVVQAEAFVERNPPEATRRRMYTLIGDFHYDIFNQYGRAKEAYEKALDLMSPGSERNQLMEKVQSLETKIENQRRMREGKPPIPEGGHDHDHGPGLPGGMPKPPGGVPQPPGR